MAARTKAPVIWRASSLSTATLLTTNLQFIDRAPIMPGGGVGHHFHNTCEEMFIIFGDEAQFTIDGRTSVVKGPPERLAAWAIPTPSIIPRTSRWNS